MMYMGEMNVIDDMTLTDGLKQNQVREAILNRIRTGIYRPGQRLPSERELAEDLDISYLTVRRGLQELVDAGVIFRRARVGTFVQEMRAVELANRVAIVLPDYLGEPGSNHPFFPIIMRAILSGLDQRDSSVTIVSYKRSQFWHDAGEAMLARRVTGAIIWASSAVPADQMRRLNDEGIKVVLLNAAGLWPELHFSTVSLDFTTTIREALQRLIDLGHRHIAWLAYEETRYRQYEEKLVAEFSAKYGLKNPSKIIRRMPPDPHEYTGYDELLTKEPPTAILMQDELTAHEVYRACQKAGLRVPEDISLVALADSSPRSHMVPLSAPDTCGLWTSAIRRATEHLLYLLTNKNDKQIEISLHASIQWKDSTGKPRVDR